MIKRITPLLLLLLIAFLCSCETHNTPAPQTQTPQAHELIYTKHARCRMQCRHIDAQEIEEIISTNNINQRKSKPNDTPCPSYAYEGYSHDHQHLRIVIAKCDNAWKVVTCIDLENEFECDCK
ncbi:MAG: DUF4258 domain-containing protein [Bacteroidetes bacterium]|nr:DUF4258 domain-containing protein [Bacteroidota bacterium]